jgi:hypothetical protein
MDPIAIVFGQGLVFIVGAVAALAAIALGTRVLWRLTGRVQRRDERLPGSADFRRLETAIDAIAIEVERISEAQRYTLALLSERTPAGQLEQGGALGPQFPPSRVNTPH